MPFTIQLLHQHEDTVIHLTDTDTGTQAELFTFGAMLNAFVINDGNGALNMVDGFTDIAEARQSFTNGFKSVKLSPFVCRMRQGSYSWQDVQLKVNGPYLNGHAIHGLLCDAAFTIAAQYAGHDQACVTLVHEYKGTDAGYPFPYTLAVTWTLLPANRLKVETKATNHHTTAIPFSDGWHPYFTTGETLDRATLQFDSNSMLVFDDELIPTGERITDMRFSDGTSLAGIVLDNCFALDTSTTARCVFGNNRVRIEIIPDKTYPYLQVYTPPHRQSIAIENLSSPPDAFNNGIDLCSLQPGETRTFTTSYQLHLQ